MPIKKAAYKHLRQTKGRTVKNSLIKQSLKRFAKAAVKSANAGNKEQLAEYKKNAQKMFAKAAQARIIKKNTAARRTSRLMKRINKALAAS